MIWKIKTSHDIAIKTRKTHWFLIKLRFENVEVWLRTYRLRWRTEITGQPFYIPFYDNVLQEHCKTENFKISNRANKNMKIRLDRGEIGDGQNNASGNAADLGQSINLPGEFERLNRELINQLEIEWINDVINRKIPGFPLLNAAGSQIKLDFLRWKSQTAPFHRQSNFPDAISCFSSQKSFLIWEHVCVQYAVQLQLNQNQNLFDPFLASIESDSVATRLQIRKSVRNRPEIWDNYRRSECGTIESRCWMNAFPSRSVFRKSERENSTFDFISQCWTSTELVFMRNVFSRAGSMWKNRFATN